MSNDLNDLELDAFEGFDDLGEVCDLEDAEAEGPIDEFADLDINDLEDEIPEAREDEMVLEELIESEVEHETLKCSRKQKRKMKKRKQKASTTEADQRSTITQRFTKDTKRKAKLRKVKVKVKVKVKGNLVSKTRHKKVTKA